MLTYPLDFSFRLFVFNPQMRIRDATGKLVFYIKQRALALKEDVKIFADEGMQNLLFQLRADRIIDFSAQYHITCPPGSEVGLIRRRGLRSIWKATYILCDASGAEIGLIQEENPWLKVIDSILSEIPFGSLIVNTGYQVLLRDQLVLKVKKRRSLFERRFRIEQIWPVSQADEALLLPSIVMAMILERTRG